MWSETLDDWVVAMAMIDTGSADNWISPQIVRECEFQGLPLDEDNNVFYGLAGEYKATEVVNDVEWQGVRSFKQKKSSFKIAGEDCGFDAILGRNFIDEEGLFQASDRPHVFSRGAKIRREVCYSTPQHLSYLASVRVIAD